MAVSGKKSFLLRIDPRLWSELESWAQQDLRSVNGQVEFLLREAVRRRGRTPPAEDDVEDVDPGDGEANIRPPG